jgi:hypothetical protein
VTLADIRRWREAARARGEFFRPARLARAFVEVGGFIDSRWLVEAEADAVLD